MAAAVAAPQTDNTAHSQAPALQINPNEALRDFEVPNGEEYTIGDGDEIEIDATGRPELSGKHLVGPDGRITLPLAGDFLVKGLTREAAADGIRKAFQQYYAAVAVTVRVVKYGSNRLLIVGHVAHPGVLYFDTAPTLLEALTKSGALPASGSESPASSVPNRCAVFRGKDQVVWINLSTLLESGGTTANVRLRRDDVVYVPAEQDDLVSVLGEVKNPGAIKLSTGTTVINVLAMAGGLTDAASKSKIRLVRPSTGMSRDLNLEELLTPKASAEVSLQRGDIIYVPKKGIAKVGYVLQQLGPAASLLLFGATLGTR
jgi:polysaccharide export outer membrane protein